MQDFAGEVVYYRAQFAVATYSLPFVEMSLGYGRERLDGLFGGVSIQPLEQVELLADYDSAQTSYAVRLNTGDWLGDTRLDLLYRFMADDQHPDNFWGIGLRVPMGANYNAIPGRGAKAVASRTAQSPAAVDDGRSCIDRLAGRLTASGYESPRFGQIEGMLVIDVTNPGASAGSFEMYDYALGEAAAACAGEYASGLVILRNAKTVAGWMGSEFRSYDGRRVRNAPPRMSSGFGAPNLDVAWLQPELDEAGQPHYPRRVRAVEPEAPVAVASPEPEGSMPVIETGVVQIGDRTDECRFHLQADLAALGLERVRVGTAGHDVVVAFENPTYTHSIVDGFGVALGAVARQCAGSVSSAYLILRDDGVSKAWLHADLAPAWAYLSGKNDELAELWTGTYAGTGAPNVAVTWESAAARRRTYAEVMVEPAISYAIGSEPGYYDYSAGLRTQLRVPLWAGAELLGSRLDPMAATDDYKPGGAFYGSRLRSGWRDVYLRQILPLGAGLFNAAHVGRTKVAGGDNTAFVDEAVWLAPRFIHSLRANYAYYRYDDPLDRSGKDTRDSLTGTVRWYSPRRGVSLDVTYGRFLYGDTGVRMLLERHFGDTLFGMYYRYESENNQVGGIQLSIPLTPRKNLAPVAGVRLTGNPGWFTSLRTSINSGDPRGNVINRNTLVQVLPLNHIERDFLDRGRLGREELLNNWPRMRNAWLEFGGGE